MLIGIFQVIQSGKLQLWPLGCVASLPYLSPDSTYQNSSYLPEVLYLSKSPHHCLSAMETEPKDGLRTFYPNRQALTVKWNGCVSSSGCLSLLQVQQGGCKQRVIDEMLHVVLLTFLLGFGAHLISYILPRKLWKKNEESSFLTSIEHLFVPYFQTNQYKINNLIPPSRYQQNSETDIPLICVPLMVQILLLRDRETIKGPFLSTGRKMTIFQPRNFQAGYVAQLVTSFH